MSCPTTAVTHNTRLYSSYKGNQHQIDKPLCFYLSKLSTEEQLKMTYKVY